jgi:hypothetical protein
MNIVKLAEIYRRGVRESALVAEICDEVLDRSGALLGEVRQVAYDIEMKEIMKVIAGVSAIPSKFIGIDET